MSLRQASFALLVLAVGMLVLGAGGFSAMEADRPVDVSVVDDEDAYLGVTAEQEAGDVNVTIVNRFANEITITQVEAGDPPESQYDTEWVVGPGTQETALYDLPTDAHEVIIHAEGKGVSIEVSTEIG